MTMNMYVVTAKDLFSSSVRTHHFMVRSLIFDTASQCLSTPDRISQCSRFRGVDRGEVNLRFPGGRIWFPAILLKGS